MLSTWGNIVTETVFFSVSVKGREKAMKMCGERLMFRDSFWGETEDMAKEVCILTSIKIEAKITAAATMLAKITAIIKILLFI